MELILLNGSANSVVHWHVGFAGEIHTFVIHVTERQQRYLRWKQWYQRRVRGGVLVQYMNCPCPVCLRQVPISTLNEHLDLCLQQNQESPIQQPPWGPYSDMDRRREEEENERLFHAFLERDQEQTKKTETDGIKCGICLKLVPFASTFFLDQCGHSFCTNCLYRWVMEQVNSKQCRNLRCFLNSCTKSIDPIDLKVLLSKEDFELYNTNACGEFIDSNDQFFHCPNSSCAMIIERLAPVTKKGGLSEAARHKEQYRFRCRSCEVEFCSSCKAVPYHENFTCTQFSEYQKSKHCRFCQVQLTSLNRCTVLQNELNIPGLVEVCSKDECLERKANVCQKTLPCGHFCNGKLPSSSIFLICFLPSETRVMPSPHTLTALLLPSSPTITPPTSPSQPSPIPHVPIQKKEK
eukprot:TRINITY_DN5426_c0_g1_i11.p1 TRINITY_DN5426_c0_g1~~TRINITY_DN5426_c0_g1_i11.p1  ORF type:complete len:407 (+),score=69.66 TRINITY_DN5426_c0_g1_i11:129-1349(+)